MNTKQLLQKIIDENREAAELGCPSSRIAVVNAQGELDRIAEKEGDSIWKLFSQQQRNLVEFSLTF